MPISATFSDGKTVSRRNPVFKGRPLTHAYRVRGITEPCDVTGFGTSAYRANKRAEAMIGERRWHHGSKHQPWLKRFDVEIVEAMIHEDGINVDGE